MSALTSAGYRCVDVDAVMFSKGPGLWDDHKLMPSFYPCEQKKGDFEGPERGSPGPVISLHGSGYQAKYFFIATHAEVIS